MKKTNVFSEQSETIAILVYTQSFLYDHASFQYFDNANLLQSIRIYFMPLLVKSDGPLPIQTGIYKHTLEGNTICSSVIFSDCCGHACFDQDAASGKTDEEFSKVAEAIMLHHPFHPLSFDYIVASDEWCEKHSEYHNIMSFSEIKEVLRLYLINKKEFEIIDHYYIDEFSYYIYRHKVLFQEYQNFWNSTLDSKNENDTNTASALGNRLLLLSICIDNARIEAYKSQNNITAMHIKYHISYLLLLITGSFDSLAWIINNLYAFGFECKKRQQIDLTNKDFLKVVEQKSAMLYSSLSQSEFLSRIEAIRELRNIIAHRNFIDTISSGDRNDNQNYLRIDQIASNKLLKAGFKEKGFFMRTDIINAVITLDLLDFLQETTTCIVNNLLKDIANEIYHNSSQISIHKLFNFPAEPYVL